jgi:hypothetical protein
VFTLLDMYQISNIDSDSSDRYRQSLGVSPYLL